MIHSSQGPLPKSEHFSMPTWIKQMPQPPPEDIVTVSGYRSLGEAVSLFNGIASKGTSRAQ